MMFSTEEQTHNSCFLLCFLVAALLHSCDRSGEIVEPAEENRFTVDTDFILKDGVPLQIKGIVYVPGYPGYLPWEIENATTLPNELVESINDDITDIRAMNANTIRFWGAPKYCYEALRNAGGLNFIQTIWVDGSYPDFQNSMFKESTKSYIRQVVDRIYSVYTDSAPPLIAYLIGNELGEASIQSTNAAHPEITSFSGNYITTESGISATQAFLAEMADYLKSYESENYGNLSLVSYANYLYTADIIDTPFLDFRCHNVYSYDIPHVRPNTAAGSSTGTMFQGWVEELKAAYPVMPLLITETGLSVSPNATHIGPPHYGYGGNSESEQATGLVQGINDISSTILPLAGVCIHEYLDAWWKFGLEDSYTQDPDDVEEWFGVTRLVQAGDWFETEFRESYHAIQQNWEN